MSPAILSILIFAICVFFFVWNRHPISTIALSGLVAMVLFGVLSFSEGFKHFAGSIVALICGMMVVGQATFDTGLAQVVGDKVIHLANHDERKIIILGTLVTGVLSAFLSNVATFQS